MSESNKTGPAEALYGWEARKDCSYSYDYDEMFQWCGGDRVRWLSLCRDMCKKDLFFLLAFGLGRMDINQPFIVEAIQEVESGPDDYTLDLWSREHYKSTIISYAEPIQMLIRNPMERISFFSFNRPIAKGFLRQIMQSLEDQSTPVVGWFPDVFWENPRRDAPKWSEDDGIVVQRKGAAKESSVEAWGLIDGQPTSKHFTHRIYDDVVTDKTVNTTDQIKKCMDGFKLSVALGTDGGTHRVAGTVYDYGDPYMQLQKRKRRKDQELLYTTRIKPIWDKDQKPVLISEKRLEQIIDTTDPYIFNCQYLLEPTNPEDKVFKEDRVRKFRKLPVVSKYILVDPANEKKKESDFTAMVVVGLDRLGNYYFIDGILDKLNLTERWEHLRDLAVRHRPMLIGYEQYGLQADLHYIEEKQLEDAVYLAPIVSLGGKTKKLDRIKWLAPIVNGNKFFVPEAGIFHKDEDLVEVLIDMMRRFPHMTKKDLIDAMARVKDPNFKVAKPEHAYAGGDTEDDDDWQDDHLEDVYDMV